MHEQSTNPGPGGNQMARPGRSVPLLNEIASIVIGLVLTSPDVSEEDKAAARKDMASLENLDIVYKQNTADELNVVVPYFPELDVVMRSMTEEELEQLSGGDIIASVVFLVSGTLASIGFACGFSGLGAVGIAAATTVGGFALGGTLGAVAAGAAIVGAVGGIAAGVVAVVGAAAGVGIAAGLGAFSGSGSGAPVNIGLAS